MEWHVGVKEGGAGRPERSWVTLMVVVDKLGGISGGALFGVWMAAGGEESVALIFPFLRGTVSTTCISDLRLGVFPLLVEGKNRLPVLLLAVVWNGLLFVADGEKKSRLPLVLLAESKTYCCCVVLY